MRTHNTKPEPLPTRVNTLWNLFGCLFYQGCLWITTVLAVVLSSNYSNSGILSFAMSVGNMFSAIGLFKVRTYQVSDIQNRFGAGNYIGFRFFTISISLILMTCYTAAISNNLPIAIATFLYLIFKADETFVDVLYGIEQKNNRMDYIGKSQIIRGACLLCGFVFPLLITQQIVFSIIGMTVLCAINTLLFDCRHANLFEDISPKLNQRILKDLIRACLLPTIANLCATSIVSIARQLYGISAGEELLGIYSSIATPAVLIQAAATYLYSPLIGSMASTLFNDGPTAFIKLFIRMFSLMVCLALVVVAGFSIVGEPLLEFVYGVTIKPYSWILPYALLATVSIAMLFYINDVLIVLRDNKSQILINCVSLAIVIASTPPLISLLSMNGINVAIIIACVPSVVMGSAIIVRYSRIR